MNPHRTLILAMVWVTAGGALAVAATDPWNAPASRSKKANPVVADRASIDAGKALYAEQCVACHGNGGAGNGPAAKDMETRPTDLTKGVMWDQTDGALFWKISSGRKDMPGFETLTTDTQRWQIVNYVRTLAPKPAATSSQPSTKTAN